MAKQKARAKATRRPTDATTRNVRASARRDAALTLRERGLEIRLASVVGGLESLEHRLLGDGRRPAGGQDASRTRLNALSGETGE